MGEDFVEGIVNFLKNVGTALLAAAGFKSDWKIDIKTIMYNVIGMVVGIIAITILIKKLPKMI